MKNGSAALSFLITCSLISFTSRNTCVYNLRLYFKFRDCVSLTIKSIFWYYLEERVPIGSYYVDGRRRQSQQLEKDFQATTKWKAKPNVANPNEKTKNIEIQTNENTTQIESPTKCKAKPIQSITNKMDIKPNLLANLLKIWLCNHLYCCIIRCLGSFSCPGTSGAS